MKCNNTWFISIEVPKTNIKLTIYNNGLVYGFNKSEKLFFLTENAVNNIKEIIKQDIYMLRTIRYLKQNKEGLIIKINDTSRKHKDIIKVVGWPYENKILEIMKNSSNIIKII